jgi:potassium efflux system protein
MIIFSGVGHAFLHPRRGVVASFYSTQESTWIGRLRWLWYALGAGGPLLLALGSLLGYLYTAATLTGHLVDTFWLALILVVINLVVMRWLALEKRKIAWQMALKEQEAQRATADEQADSAGVQAPVIESKPLDLDAVDQQTTRLVHAGLFFVGALATWGIWSEVVPALGVLDQVSLWSQTTTIDGQEKIVPVTLADLLLAVFVAGVTAVASANLPGLMEIAVLQRMTLQPGSRYAINTLLRYVVVTVGVVAVLNIVGWKWSQIQWLVAALSVGLGFGLQEIVANFVSGLVILFERPVRVGDTVTVGELTGTVSRVRIRATTITDWDRKEIIVPNKSFITEQVINWTLSDPITRIVIPVGISYGSDVELAHRVMQETLYSMPLVLDEPPPKVYFVGFGDSSLNFNLYVHSRELSDRLPMMHAVHEEILGALRKNGIEIPFPQRDLHLRSVDERITAFKQGDRGNAEPED